MAWAFTRLDSLGYPQYLRNVSEVNCSRFFIIYFHFDISYLLTIKLFLVMRVVKFFIFSMIATMASIVVTSCSKEYSSPLKGQVINDLTFDSSQSSKSVSIADVDLTGFTIKSSELWCTAAAQGKSLNVTVQANDTYGERQATVTLTDPGDQTSISFKVLQKQNDAIIVDGSTFSVPEDGGEVSIKVQSNVNYKVEIPSDATWLKNTTKASTRGLETSTITLTAEKNNSGDERETVVKLTNTDSGVSSQFTVKQELTPSFTIDKDEFSIDELGDVVNVNVTSNIEIDVQFSDDWVSSDGTTEKGDFSFVQKIKVEPLPNDQDSRTATVTFSDKLGKWSLSKVVTIKQTRSLALEESDVEIMIGKNYTLNVVNNTGKSLSWKSSNTSVATVNNNGTVTGVGEGSATITVTSADKKHSATCTVTVKDITGFIKAQSTGGATVEINGLIQYGSSINWTFLNDSPETVKLKSLQLVDGENGSEGNIMEVNENVSGGSSVSYSTSIGLLGIHAPVTCRFRYEYNGKEYMTTAVYESSGVIFH